MMNSPEGMPPRGRGRGRAWNGPGGPGQFRPPFQRMPGPGFDGPGPGPGPRPFFPRGGGPGGPMRGRGRMRGKAWMM